MLKGKITPKQKINLKKNDTVVVLSGSHKGKKGKVLEVIQEKSQARVEGLNMIKKHVKPGAKTGKGGIVEKEGTIHVSNLRIFNESIGKITRSTIKKLGNGQKQRVCKKSGEPL